MQSTTGEGAASPASSASYVNGAEWLKIAVVLLLAAAVLFSNLGGWELFNPDEPRYAQVAREMLDTGNYIVPSLGAEQYSHKPPFFFWLIALSSRLYGEVNAAAARFPSALSALGVLLLTCLLGRKLYGPLTGFLSGLILFTVIEFFWIATRAHLDMTLTFWITLSHYLFYCGYTSEKNRSRLYLLSFCSSGFAILTKGPVGLILVLITISLFLSVTREFYIFRELRFGRGLLIAVSLVALWLVPACLLGGSEYTSNILLKENLGIIKNSFSHRAPFYFYLIHFPRDFMPWTLFIPAAVIHFWRQKKIGKAPGILFPLVWFIGGFIFLSCVSSKRNIYLLPLYPAAALMMAAFWRSVLYPGAAAPRDRLPASIRYPLYIFSAAVGLGGLFILVCALGRFRFAYFITGIDFTLYPAALAFCSAGYLGIMLVRRNAPAFLLFYFIIAVMIGSFFFTVLKGLPGMDQGKATRDSFSKLEQTAGPEQPLLYFRIDPSLFYYLKRKPSPEIREFDKLTERLAAPGPIFCLMQEKTFRKAPETVQRLLFICGEAYYEKEKYVLLVKQPVVTPPPDSN
jgi:4-amino-4-deoxy-L-arabinose transferase-like glycosyltransferase